MDKTNKNKNKNKNNTNDKAKEQSKKMNMEVGEDTTKYGEWMSSFFGWITPDQQKGRTEELNNMTKNKDN